MFEISETLRLYFDQIAKYPLLTPSEEIELGKRVREGPDSQQALDKLVISNLRLVVPYAKEKSKQHGIPLEDTIGYGNEGLIVGAEKYDYSLGNRFSTYVIWWIKQRINKGIIDNEKDIRVPSSAFTEHGKIRGKIRLSGALTIEDELKELEKLVESGEVKESRAYTFLNTSSDMLSLEGMTNNSEQFNWEEINGTEDPSYEQIEIKDTVDKLFENTQLNPRERSIVREFYGIDSMNHQGASVEELSKKYGVSLQRIRQIKDRAEKKLSRARI